MKRIQIISMLFLFMFMFSNFVFTQSKIILKYKYCYHASFDSLNYDYSCKMKRDSVFKTILITNVKERYLSNDKLLSSQKTDSLKMFLQNNDKRIKELIIDLASSYKARFVPPKPLCYEFEEYTFYCKNKSLKFKILDNVADELGHYLHKSDLKMFKDLLNLIQNN